MTTAGASWLKPPRTPQECRSAPLWITPRQGGGRGTFRQKVGRGSAMVRWIISWFYTKSLKLEQFPRRNRLEIPRFGCFIPPFCLFRPHAIFGAFLSLSLYLIEREREVMAWKEKGRHTGIHGFTELYKKAPTGLHPTTPPFRGIRWVLFPFHFSRLGEFLEPSTDPRVVFPVVSLKARIEA